MTISREAFELECKEFVWRCQQLNDHNWVIRYQRDLSKTGLMLQRNDQVDRDGKLVTIEYNIIHNENYGVPVLYMCASDMNGVPVEMFPESEYITQTEHPYLFRPFYMVHPCKTETLMKSHEGMRSNKENYLIAWLSTVGTLVELKLDIRLSLSPKPPEEDTFN